MLCERYILSRVKKRVVRCHAFGCPKIASPLRHLLCADTQTGGEAGGAKLDKERSLRLGCEERRLIEVMP
jgi:hypothetical protein